jgi:peptidoglycan hydrolase CwlO-like protein
MREIEKKCPTHADITTNKRKTVYIRRTSYIKIPLTAVVRIFSMTAVLVFFFTGSVNAPQSYFAAAQEEEQIHNSQEERAELERQLAEYEKQIEDTQKTIDEYKKKGNTLQNEIYTLNARISKLNLQIKAVTVNISKLNEEITETQKQINRTENTIDTHKDALAEAIRNVREADAQNIITILLANEKLSDFFGTLNDMALVQDNLRVSLENITKLRQDLLEQKDELSMEKEDVENLKAIQQAQKNNVQYTQTQKQTLLKDTKGRESEYQKILKKTQETAAQIRTRIFELLGGGQLTFEKAYDFARIAEKATGVRASLILAILNRESLLGKNTGKCFYTTAMHPTRDVPYFLDLTKRLNIDPKSDFAKVSCPNSHGTYGGAMGPAQFIPSTWKIYESKISAVTGNNPPNPWNNADAFAGTAVYIRDLLASSSCINYAKTNQHIVPYQTLLERCAASKYYAGGNWYTYRMWYGDPVVQQANAYEDDIAVLKGQ